MSALTPAAEIRVQADRGQEVGGGPWVQSALWDGFWMFSALWGCALLFGLNQAMGWQRAAALLFVFNGALGLYHSWSTTFMVLGSSSLRAARRANPVRYLWTPLAIFAVSMSVGVGTGATRSFPTTDRFGLEVWPWVLYLALFWVGHFWHFGKQDFGVLSIYRARAGQHDLRARQIDQAYAFGMMFAIQPVVYLSVLASSPLGQAFYNLVPLAPQTVRLLASGAVGLAGIATLVVVGIELARPSTSLPKLAYYGIMLAHPVILYHSRFGLAFYYLIAYFWSHWLIAIGLVARINTGYYRERGQRRPTALLRHAATIGGIALVVTIVTAGFSQFRVFSGRGYKEALASVTPEQGAIVGAFLGFFLFEQLLHYYCDRCLFRMRDPAIREAIGPYL